MTTYKHQKPHEIIDITDWTVDEEFGRSYPEGARAKTLVISPSEPKFSFIEKKKRYLFKYSKKSCPEQFWIEILAYRLGIKMDIEVPPTFVAINKERGETAAFVCRKLIENILKKFYLNFRNLKFP